MNIEPSSSLRLEMADEMLNQSKWNKQPLIRHTNLIHIASKEAKEKIDMRNTLPHRFYGQLIAISVFAAVMLLSSLYQHRTSKNGGKGGMVLSILIWRISYPTVRSPARMRHLSIGVGHRFSHH
jgi:hypothetical protein